MPLNQYSIQVQTKQEMGLVEHVRLDKRQYLNADRDKVVEEGHEDAAFLFGNAGQLVSRAEADRLGASYGGKAVSGDDALDTLHVEVETPNLIPGSARVEGSGKATIPVTQSDRAVASGLAREDVSGRAAKHRRTEGEALLSGDLKPLPDQRIVGETSRTKQTGQMVPDHYTEAEKSKVKPAGRSAQQQQQSQQAPQQTGQEKQQPAPGGDKMAQKPADK